MATYIQKKHKTDTKMLMLYFGNYEIGDDFIFNFLICIFCFP